MTTLAHLRKTALSLPETAEHDHGSGVLAFTIGESCFASSMGDFVELHLPDEEVERVLAKHPTAERLDRRGVRIPLADINGKDLNHWLRRAWRASAPERLAELAAAADSALPGAVGDLPRAIGRPATRALVSAGITTLAQVAERTEAELMALHGIGPKAIRILEEALSATGRRLKS